MKQIRATLNTPYANWGDEQMDAGSFQIAAGLQGNKYFTSISTKIDDFVTRQQAYRETWGAAASRDKNLIKDKNTAKAELIKSLLSLSNAVAEVADGNIDKLTSTNMPIRKQRQPAQPNPPTKLKLATGVVAGILNCKWASVKGKRLYVVAYTPNPLSEKAEWTMLNSAQASYSIGGLDSGSKVWVKIGVIGIDNVTLWGDAILSPYIP